MKVVGPLTFCVVSVHLRSGQMGLLPSRCRGYLAGNYLCSRSRWPRDLRRRSPATRLQELRVRFPPVAWMSVSCEYYVLSGRGLCQRPITRPEESFRVWFV